MAKQRIRPRRRGSAAAPPAPAAAAPPIDGDDHHEGSEQTNGWAAIPGRRLDVDIADNDNLDPDDGERGGRRGAKRRRNPPASVAAIAENPTEDEKTAFDPREWSSRHYDSDDEDFDPSKDSAKDEDLFDPNPVARSNDFDVGGKAEGANDAGVFLSLEVIPANAYKVEKTGDEKSGFVTKVVFADQAASPSSPSSSQAPPTEEEAIDDGKPQQPDKPLTKKERQKKERRERRKLKQKARREQNETSDNSKVDDSNAAEPAKEETGKATNPSDDAAKAERLERKKAKRKAKREQAKERKRLRKDEAPSSNAASDSSPKNPQNDQPPKTGEDQSLKTTEEIERLQTAWSVAAPGVVLHPTLCAGLHSMGYERPTPVQGASLPAAILGRRDVVGAAPTGSGKTLSYGLPALQYLLEREDAEKKEEDDVDGKQVDGGIERRERLPLQALILTPTRELAIQVTAELRKVCQERVKVGTIVGGFAEVKQRRTLEKARPPILVGTPGRLWELMSSKEYSHLNDLTQLRFLIVDEADRLIKQGSFPQLQQIFDVINRANPPPEDPDDLEDESDSDSDDENRLKSLRGVRGEAKVVMLDDSILAAIEKERNRGMSLKGEDVPAPMEMDDDEFEEQQRHLLEEDGSEDDSDEDRPEPVHRQTFVYSATLTLPPSMHHLIKKDPVVAKKKRGRSRKPTTVDGAIAEILDVAGARGQTKVVDMSNATTDLSCDDRKGSKASQKDNSKTSKDDASSDKPSLARRLPPGLSLGEIQCAQRHKDSHLYGYLVTTRQGSSGPCLVFCNSIAAVRRVGETLRELGLPAKMLHAQMAQKSRLGALESLRKSNSRSVVVCSDVAARGLDISSVTTVIHYDVARSVDTFIHRAGRTARGMGEKAVGTSISLVAPAEEREHQKICEAVRGSKSLGQVHIDSRLLNEAQERVSLATKIVGCNDVESQVTRKNKWLQDAAKDAGLEVDDDMMESGLLDGDQRDRQRFIEAKRAKAELRQLLATPIRKQHFGKFLSGPGLRESIKAEGEVKPFVVKKSFPKGKHRRKKVQKKK